MNSKTIVDMTTSELGRELSGIIQVRAAVETAITAGVVKVAHVDFAKMNNYRSALLEEITRRAEAQQ